MAPKIEGKKNFNRKSARHAGLAKKEFVSKVVGLESHTFDVGEAKYAAKYQKLVDAIANHIQKDYKGGPEIAHAIRDLELPVIDVPAYPVPTAGAALDPGAEYLWRHDITEAKKRITQLAENLKRAYALVIGQCSEDLLGKIKGSTDYPAADTDQDAVKLLLIISGYCCRFDDHQQSVVALESAKHRMSTFYQTSEMTASDYIEFFKALVGVVETYGGAFGNEPGLIRAELIKRGVTGTNLLTPDSVILKAVTTTCREQYLSAMVLQGSDNSRYYQLKTDLANNMTKGTDNYPKMLVDTMRLITDYKVPPRLQRVQPGGETGVAFVQDGGRGAKKPAGAATPQIKDITCWHCAKTGHYKTDCPLLQNIDQEHGVQNLSIENCYEGHNLFLTDDGCALVQKGKTGVQGLLSPWHVFINTCTSYASTPNKNFLENVRLQERGLVGHSNAGSCGMDRAGRMGAIEKVWYNEGGVATIVPLKMLERIFPISYQSHKGMNPVHFVIHSDQGDIVVKNNGVDMPYLDVRELEVEVALCFVQMV